MESRKIRMALCVYLLEFIGKSIWKSYNLGLFVLAYLSYTTCLAEVILNPEHSKFHNVYRRDVSEILNRTSGRHYDFRNPHQNVSPTGHSSSRSLGGRALHIYESDPTKSNLAPHPSRTYLPAAHEGYARQKPGQESINQLFPGHSSSQYAPHFQLHKGQTGFHSGSQTQTGFSSKGFTSQSASFPSHALDSTSHSTPSYYGLQGSTARYGQPQQAYYHQSANPQQQFTSSGQSVQSLTSFSHGHQSYGQGGASNINLGHLGTSDIGFQHNPFSNQLTSDRHDTRLQSTGFSSSAFHGSASQSSSGIGGVYSSLSSGQPSVKRDYDFGYGVAAHETGTEFHHEESRRDGRSKGKYEVLLPDGRLQVVEYEADDTGFWPKVTYQGRANQDPLSSQNVNTVLTDLLNRDLKRTRDPKGIAYPGAYSRTGGLSQFSGRESSYRRNLQGTSQHFPSTHYQDNTLEGQFLPPGHQYQPSDLHLGKQFGDRSVGRSDLLPPHAHGVHYSQPYAKNRPQIAESPY